MNRYNLLHKQSIYFVIVFTTFFSGLSGAFQREEASTISSAAINDSLHNPKTVVVRYTETPNMGEAEGGASLRVYSDGYAAVYYPAYMKRAGNYGIQLEQKTMNHLWTLLTAREIMEFDEQHLLQRISAVNQTQKELLSELSNVSDASHMLIEIYPNRYKSLGFGTGSSDELKKITWSGLKWDMKRFPEIREIQTLAMLQQALLAVMARPDLEKID